MSLYWSAYSLLNLIIGREVWVLIFEMVGGFKLHVMNAHLHC